MTSSKMQKDFYASFSDLHCFGAILRLQAMRLEKNGYTSMKDNRLSLNFRKSTGKVKYLIPSLRKSQLKFSVFRKI
jgi:hypothetical protein